MNKVRRKSLNALVEQVDILIGDLDRFRDDEQEYFDSMPENFQDGDKGTSVQDCVGFLDDALAAAEELKTNIEQSVE